jgi:15-cis-phytoene synthase
MTAGDLTDLGLGEAAGIAVLYAPARLRRRYRSLLSLDTQLMRIALAKREPMLTQIRLAWWREACAVLSETSGSPLVAVLATDWRGNSSHLVRLVDAWEEMSVGSENLLQSCEAVADARAAAVAETVGVPHDGNIRAAARRWTLADLWLQCENATQRLDLESAALEIPRPRLPRTLRPLAVLEGLTVRAMVRRHATPLGDRWSPFAALRLGIFGR